MFFFLHFFGINTERIFVSRKVVPHVDSGEKKNEKVFETAERGGQKKVRRALRRAS